MAFWARPAHARGTSHPGRWGDRTRRRTGHGSASVANHAQPRATSSRGGCYRTVTEAQKDGFSNP